jgi:hypothetical protein
LLLSLAYSSTLKVEALRPSEEMGKIYRTTVSLKDFLFSGIFFIAGDTKYANNQCSCHSHKQLKDKKEFLGCGT